MFKRMTFLLIMGAAIGLPYLATSSSDWHSFFGSSRSPDGHGAAAGYSSAAGSPAGTAGPKEPSVEGAGVKDLNEVIRFDGSPAWVMARWPRVTAGLAELDLQGYRVPLVTGTSPDDLAGSLTYYFDKNQRVAFINFKGTTGDPRKLVALVTSRYQLLQQKTDDPSLSLYQKKWNGQPLSELRVRPARLVRSGQPNTRYEVELAMKRP